MVVAMQVTPHTMNGRQFVTHLVPSGVFHGVRSVVGPGSVAETSKSTLEEIKYLEWTVSARRCWSLVLKLIMSILLPMII
jgi:adenylosuccinate synthase